MSTYLTEALVYERINRFQTEAANHRRSRMARPQGPGAMDRMAQAIGRGLVAIGESLKVDRRPRIPAI
jgi:hypothetical protein